MVILSSSDKAYSQICLREKSNNIPYCKNNSAAHTYADENNIPHQNPVTGSAVTIYGNGTTALKVGNTTINNKQATLFTDILASYQYTKNSKGKITPSTGKVIVGITMSDSKPTLTKNKIVDTAAAKIAKATIKNGIITATVAGKANGIVYLWVMDSRSNSYLAVTPIAGTNQFTITGKGLKNNKDTKASIVFTCDQNGKKVKFSVTVKK